jgi:hypothetical protein
MEVRQIAIWLRTGESITVVFPMWADGTRSVPATFLGTVIDSPVLSEKPSL